MEDVSCVGGASTCVYTLLKERDHTRPRPTPNAVWVIGSQMLAERVPRCSHLHSELSTCDRITLDTWISGLDGVSGSSFYYYQDSLHHSQVIDHSFGLLHLKTSVESVHSSFHRPDVMLLNACWVQPTSSEPPRPQFTVTWDKDSY